MNLPVSIESKMLSQSDFSGLAELASELSESYAKRQIFRTETEARISVLQNLKHPTPASKYWQALREQMVMLEQLAIMSFDYRRLDLSLRRHRISMATASGLDAEEIQIEIDECVFKQASMRTVAADRVREIHMWSKIKSELAGTGGFDTDDVDNHQLVSYTTQFILTANTLDKDQMSADEFSNLNGQLQTAIRRCSEKGVLDELRKNIPDNLLAQLVSAL